MRDRSRRPRTRLSAFVHSINFRRLPKAAIPRLVIRRTHFTSHAHHHPTMPNPSAIAQTPALILWSSLSGLPPFPWRRRGKRESTSPADQSLFTNPRSDHSMLEHAFLFLLSCPFSALSFETSAPLRRIFSPLNLFSKEIRLKPSHFRSREHEIRRRYHPISTKTGPKQPRIRPKLSQKTARIATIQRQKQARGAGHTARGAAVSNTRHWGPRHAHRREPGFIASTRGRSS